MRQSNQHPKYVTLCCKLDAVICNCRHLKNESQLVLSTTITCAQLVKTNTCAQLVCDEELSVNLDI